MYKYHLLTIFTVILFTELMAQGLMLKDTLFNTNHIKVDINFFKNIANVGNSSKVFINPPSRFYEFGIGYVPKLSDNFRIEINSSFGFLSVNYKVKGLAGVNTGTEGFSYFMRNNWLPYSAYEVLLIKLANKNKHFLQYSFGFGIRNVSYFYDNEVSYSSINKFDEYNYRFKYTVRKGVFPYIVANIAYGIPLSNYNILNFSLEGKIGITSIAEGEWLVFPNTEYYETGRYVNKGSGIGLNVSYVFTGIQNQIRKQILLKDGNLNPTEQVKNEKRKRKETKQWFLTLNGCRKNDYSKSTNPSFINNGVGKMFQVDFSIGKIVARSLFLTFGIKKHTYWDNINILGYNMGYTNAYSTIQSDVGFLYQYILKEKKVNLINIMGGVSLGVNTNFNSHGSRWGNGTINGVPFSYESDDYNVAKVFPLAYFGLSKDVRIFNDMYLTLNSRYYQGFTPSYQQDFTYYYNTSTPQYTQLIHKGSHLVFGIGLSYYFGIKTITKG